MERDVEYRRELVMKYQREMEPLMRYLPWFEDRYGKQVSMLYSGDDFSDRAMSFPVYEGTLLSFVKEAQKTSLMDRNYMYLYNKYHMPTPKDERERIEKVTIKDMEILTGVLSKYVLSGMTKGNVWPLAVEEGIFLAILKKFEELFVLWCQPTYRGEQQEY